MSEDNKEKTGYKGSFADEDELNKGDQLVKAKALAEKRLADEQPALFQKLDAIIEALTEKEQGAIFQLEGIKGELSILNKNFDAFFNFLANIVSDKPTRPSKTTPPPSKPAPSVEDKLKKMIGPKLMAKLHIENREESFAVYMKGFIGTDFGTIKSLFEKNGGGWVPKTGELPEEAGYFGINKEDL